MVAVLSVCLSGVVALAARVDPLAVAAAIAIAQLMLAGAMFAGPAVPAPHTAFVVVAAGGLTATTFAAWPDILTGFDGSNVSAATDDVGRAVLGIAPAAAMVVVGSLVREMLRRDGRGALTESVTTTVAVGVAATTLAVWVAAARTDQGPQVLAIAAAVVAAAALLWSIPGPRVVLGSLAAIGGVAAGIAVNTVVDDPLETPAATGLAVLAALLAVAGRAMGILLADQPARRVAAETVLPLVVVGPVAFWVGHLFGS